ncbi:VWA domain-containing protein [Rhodobacter sp. SY28-1]|uniref:vWA domain-containing protein n=1 Tax=Rhodobacter sp. SY28-1 TaxID=2562317 RepID=UPI0010BFD3DB|nr:VWA domain-containing protein [Rhodobacter sp. SY28-1]
MRLAVFLRGLVVAQAIFATPLLAEGRSIIVLDASGSMWGQIDGRAKLEIAREALGAVLSEMPPEAELGLMAYGHREKGSCSDIELVVPPATGTAQAITDAANAMKFLGKTPLTEAVRQAASELKSTEAKATVILITDGIETCEADPCALGAELEASGVDFTAHVVGFGLTAEEGATVACLAENTGGRYIEAKDAGSLVDALKTTVVVAEPEPEPAPVPEPEPAPAALAENVDPAAYLVEGGAELDDRIIRDVVFSFAPLGADGQPAGDTTTIYGTTKGSLAPGRYRMVTELHKARVEQDVEIGPATDLSAPVAVLDAGVLNLTLRAAPGADPDPDAFWELRGAEELYESGYGQTYRVFPSGEHALKVVLGSAEVNQSVVIDAGQVTDLDLVIGVGLAAVEATYSDSVKVEGGDHFVEIFEAKKDIDGNRKSVGYSYGTGATFDLPAGDYVAVVSLGAAQVEVPFSIKVGERTDIVAPLNAGVAAFTSPTDEFIEVLAAKPDINGNRASFGYGYGPAWETTLPAGDYVVKLSKEDKSSETPLTVKAGERSEVALALP